tara:strand:- start:3104 stop:4144 length:1041 start_codon:yes stop_codon:yes gene_type:complete
MNKSNKSNIKNFRSIYGQVIDVRSPDEFKKGHLPGAINIPLFSNEERRRIGHLYKNRGREQSISLGINLTSKKISYLTDQLILQKNIQISKGIDNPALKFYCSRGGMRSYSMNWLCHKLAINSLILENGYKSYRNSVLEIFREKWNLYLIGGKTGTGKTELIKSLANKNFQTIDLEKLANHRGSVYGGLGQIAQPSTEQFENLFAEKLSEYMGSNRIVFVEAESANIGACRIPFEFFNQMKKAPLIEIQKTDEERIIKLVQIYSSNSKESLKEATLKIRKRLGSERTNKALSFIDKGEWENVCIQVLDYYDRCYENEINKREKVLSIDLSNISLTESLEKIINIIG